MTQPSNNRGPYSWPKDKIKTQVLNYLASHNKETLDKQDLDGNHNLPSTKTIERKFGSIIEFRKELGLKITHHNKGQVRRDIANTSNKASLESEKNLYHKLVNLFGEPFVHYQSSLPGEKTRLDFRVFHTKGDFLVDIFTATTTRNFQNHLNAKLCRYINIQKPLYLVVDSANPNLHQEEILRCCDNRKVPIPNNTHVFNLHTFLKHIKTLTPYHLTP